MTAAQDAAAVASLLPIGDPIAQLARMSLDREVREENERRMSITIKSPAPGFTGTSTFGPLDLTFRDGVAEHDGELSEGLRGYLEGHGYGIGGEDATRPEPVPALTDLDGNRAPDSRTVRTVVEINPDQQLVAEQRAKDAFRAAQDSAAGA